MKSGELFKVEGFGVIVTGGASGLGLGMAEAMAQNGARVTLLDVDAGRIEQETHRLQSLGFAVRGEAVDVRDHAAIDRAFDAAVAAHGRLDVVFANAGIDPGPGFVGSWAGSERPRNPAGVMTAKAGAAHLMRQVALELAADQITVNAIAPGFFATNIGGGHAKQPQVQEAMSRVIPMHRVGFAEDIKGLALFLASPASAYVTGQQISIDGGWALGVAD